MSANEATPANYAPEFYGRQHATTLRPHEPMHPRGACADCDEAYGWMIQQGASFPPRAVLYNDLRPPMPTSVRRVSNRLWLSVGVTGLVMASAIVYPFNWRAAAFLSALAVVIIIVAVAREEVPT